MGLRPPALAAGLLGSMGRVGFKVDNTMMESFWLMPWRDLLDTRRWATQEQLASAIFEWIEAWYDARRRHTSLGMLSPSNPKRFTRPSKRRHDRHTIPVRRTGSGASRLP